MADENANAGTEQMLSDAKAALDAILALRDQAESATRAAEEANRKANSESGFAFNAKQNAEEHAKAIAQVRGTVEADFNWLTTTKKNADDAAVAIAAAKQTAESAANSATQLKGTSEAEVAAINALKQRAESALSASEKARDDGATAAKRASDDAAVVTQARATAETSASTVQALQAQVSEAAAKAQADTSTITVRATESQAMLNSLTEVTETAKNAQMQVNQHEQELAQLKEQSAELRTKIEGLLPGATSAGLASAFREQKARFAAPQRNWLWIFVGSLMALLAAGSIGLPSLVQEKLTWDSILLHVANRLPLIVPLVWLALFAGRNYTLAQRLQEEYAFKEALSTSFEGYKREMTDIPAAGDQLLPLLTLCNNLLQELALRPGRLYEGKHDDITPLSPLAKFLGETKLLGLLGRRGLGGDAAVLSAILKALGNGGSGKDARAAGDASTKT